MFLKKLTIFIQQDEYKIKSKDVVNILQEEKVTENFMNGKNIIFLLYKNFIHFFVNVF